MADADLARLRLDLTGAVQGVGFRPFVYRLAQDERLSGFVHNTVGGVSIEVEGASASLARFMTRLDTELPPHATVLDRHMASLAPHGGEDFVIAPSAETGGRATVMLADLATCADCLRETLDPADRRYLYPFTSCVRCGPRYSLIEALPYDRARTTMRHFPLCAACRAEYTDPGCRRFHAEPIACHDCGPQLSLWDTAGRVAATRHAALQDAVGWLRRGLIVALKGVGGFQLLAEAANESAVRHLRDRKRRPRKPFALMVPTLEAVRRMARVSETERRLLESPAAPIVVLRGHSGADGLAAGVAPDNPCLGVMLPYTPLHHLLLREFGRPLVATSGNLGDEPIVADETEALDRLAGIADGFLVHDRPIHRPVDDSVVRVMAGREVVLRCARGYGALPFVHSAVQRPIVALGGQQKSAVAAGGVGRIFLGPHIGDLTSHATRRAFAHAAAQWPGSHGIEPEIVACDTHPDYHSTDSAAGLGLPITRVPHHLAHVLACMVDHGLEGPVLGVAWDGTGHGGDGTIWGGEFLAVDTGRYRRVAHLRQFRLPGGEAAVREPRRAALGLLHAIGGEAALVAARLSPNGVFTPAQRTVLARMLDRRVNSPVTSSAGRLFDAVSALLGLCQVSSFEGEAAMALEFAADRARWTPCLPRPAVLGDTTPLMIDWQPLVSALIEERLAGMAPEPLAAALLDGLADAIVTVASHAGLERVVLTGGCFQNARLTELAVSRLREAGFTPFWHHLIPPNDGGLAVGQVAFAASPLIEEKT